MMQRVMYSVSAMAKEQNLLKQAQDANAWNERQQCTSCKTMSKTIRQHQLRERQGIEAAPQICYAIAKRHVPWNA